MALGDGGISGFSPTVDVSTTPPNRAYLLQRGVALFWDSGSPAA